VRAFGDAGVKAWGDGRPMHPRRTEADYRRIVEQYVVRDYNGAPRPRVAWETNRGTIETELYAGDAPLATDYLLALAGRGKLAGVMFERVVPNFVAQQGTAELEQFLQRDEVSRHRLTRGNLSWGSVISQGRAPAQAYDTGPAVYTFGITPQPHNEGDFTALGRVVKGMDVVDRIELGDVVRRARVIPPGGK
jgi:peptidylprolyl isomerase